MPPIAPCRPGNSFRTTRSVILACAVGTAALVVPAAAAAQVPPPPGVPGVNTSSIEYDQQLSTFSADVECVRPPTGQAACPVRVVLAYRRNSGYPKFDDSGPLVEVAEQTLTVPDGAKAPVTIKSEKIIRAVAGFKGAKAVTAHLSFGNDGESATNDWQTTKNYGTDCGRRPYLVPWAGPGTLTELPSRGDPEEVQTHLIVPGSTYRVTGKSISFAFNGIKYKAPKDTRFSMSCAGQTEVAGGKALVTPVLQAGRFDVTTARSKMKQPAAFVLTYEGLLGTRAKSNSRFTVRRAAARQISSISFKKGSGAITPFNTRERSPCTAGQKLQVDRRGRISGG